MSKANHASTGSLRPGNKMQQQESSKKEKEFTSASIGSKTTPKPPAAGKTNNKVAVVVSPSPTTDLNASTLSKARQQHRAAQHALLEEQQEILYSHPILPPSTMTLAREMYDHYLQLQRRSSAQSREGSTASRPTAGSKPPTVGPKDDDNTMMDDGEDEERAEEELSPSTVQKLLLDLGVSMTENEIKDTVFVLRQSSDILQYNELVVQKGSAEEAQKATAAAEAERRQLERDASRREDEEESKAQAQSKDGKGSRSQSQKATPRGNTTALASATATTTATPQRKPAANAGKPTTPQQDLTISFRLFVDLLSMNLRDVTKDTEMQKLWKQLDADQDDMLNAKDIVAAFQRVASENEQLSKEQVDALLAELDCDNDRVVSFSDFLTSMNTN